MEFIKRFYPESNFGGFTNIDGTIAFYSHVNALIKPSDIVLDIGCGKGTYSKDEVSYRKNLRILKGKCKQVIGIDIDPDARENPFIDKFLLIQGDQWPIDAGQIDLCVCDFVLEHVKDPENFFSELNRVIKPKGLVFIRTSNVNSLFGIISRIVPNKFHHHVLSMVKIEKKEINVYPTFYRINTIRKVRRYLTNYGFRHTVFGFESEPTYFSGNIILFGLAVVHQRLIPNYYKSSIHAFGIKNY